MSDGVTLFSWSAFNREIPSASRAAFSLVHDGTVIFSGDDFLKYCGWNYASRVAAFYDVEDIEQAITQLQERFTQWAAQRAGAFARLLDTLAEQYDPLENYDRREEGGWKDTNSIGARKNTSKSTPVVQMTSENYVTGDNSSTPVLQGKTVTSTNASATNFDTIESEDQAATDTQTRLFQEYRVHGNIGVTTSAQMAEGEIFLRTKYNLVKLAMDEFVDLVSFYL